MFSTSSDKAADQRLEDYKTRSIYARRVPPSEEELIAEAVRNIEGNPQLMHNRRRTEDRLSPMRKEMEKKRSAMAELRWRLRRLAEEEEERGPARRETLRQARIDRDPSAYTFGRIDLLRKYGDGIDSAAENIRRTMNRGKFWEAVKKVKKLRPIAVPSAEPSLAPGAVMEDDSGEEPRPSQGVPVQPEKDPLIDASSSSDDEDEEGEGRGAGKSRARRKSRVRKRSRSRRRSRVRKRSRARKKSRKQLRRRKYSRKRK